MQSQKLETENSWEYHIRWHENHRKIDCTPSLQIIAHFVPINNFPSGFSQIQFSPNPTVKKRKTHSSWHYHNQQGEREHTGPCIHGQHKKIKYSWLNHVGFLTIEFHDEYDPLENRPSGDLVVNNCFKFS